MTKPEKEQLAMILPMVGAARFALKDQKISKADRLLKDIVMIVQELLGLLDDRGE